MARRFMASTDSDSEPMTAVELDTKWSRFLPDFSKRQTDGSFPPCRDSLSRWARDANPGDEYPIGKITVHCVHVPDDDCET